MLIYIYYFALSLFYCHYDEFSLISMISRGMRDAERGDFAAIYLFRDRVLAIIIYHAV